MSRWFRHYAGMMRDDKLVSAAIRAKQPVERVVWIWGAILESAAEIDDAGRYDVDPAEIAYFLRADQADVDAVLSALASAGRVADGAVVKWGNRQFSSDRSKDRVAAHRERKREERDRGNGLIEKSNIDVTLHDRHRNAPETDTEIETDIPPKPPRKRGGEGKHFLPDDWQVPPVSDLPPKAQACAKHWTAESYAAHAEAFICYWRSERKMKSDWRGTWANRVIDLHAKVMRDQKFGQAPPAASGSNGKPYAPTSAADCERSAAFWESQGDQARAAEMRRQAETWREKPPDGPVAKLVAQTARQLHA